jgi:hypothetical protein
MSDGQPLQRAYRGECLVGDWVLASAMPDWSTGQLLQSFVPPGKTSERWTFRGSYYIDSAGDPVAIWRREQPA